MAGVFETGLALAITHLDFLWETMRNYRATRGQGFDRAKYETDFDAFMERQHAQTLGNLIKRAKGLASMPGDLKEMVDAAKIERDFIAHHYFRERADEFCTSRGRDQMIAELDRAHAVFERADKAVSEWTRPYRAKLGLTDESFERFYAEYKASLGLSEDA